MHIEHLLFSSSQCKQNGLALYSEGQKNLFHSYSQTDMAHIIEIALFSGVAGHFQM